MRHIRVGEPVELPIISRLATLTMSNSCYIPANPDIAGIGVRTSIYVQTLLSFYPALVALADGEVSDGELEIMDELANTNFLLAFAMLISCFVQALTVGLTSYHASIVLSMSWLSNSGGFIYFQLYVRHSWNAVMGSRRPTFLRVVWSYAARLYGSGESEGRMTSEWASDFCDYNSPQMRSSALSQGSLQASSGPAGVFPYDPYVRFRYMALEVPLEIRTPRRSLELRGPVR